DLAEEKLGHPLPPQRRLDFQIDDADAVTVPAWSKSIHLPKIGSGDRSSRVLVEQLVFVHFDRPEHALVPPVGRRAQIRMDLEALAIGRESAVSQRQRLIEYALKNQGGVPRLIAVMLQKGPGRCVAFQKPGGAAAAIEAEGKRVQSTDRPSSHGA